MNYYGNLRQFGRWLMYEQKGENILRKVLLLGGHRLA